MNCNEYENLITEYLENRATPSQRNQMESHLSECEKCRELAEKERAVIEQLSKIPLEQCPDEIITCVMESIQEHGMSFWKRIHSWLMPGPSMRYGVVSLAGSLVILMLVLFLYIPLQHRQSMNEVKYSQEEIRQATTEVRLALAYFAVYSRKTETVFEKIDLVDPIIKPMEGEFKKAIGKIPYI